MENLASKVPNPLIFDLKGSTRNRKVSINGFNSYEDMPKNIVYKDLDFIENIKSLPMSEESFQYLVKTVKKDIKILKKFKIMDYSLLVIIGKVSDLINTGIHRFVARSMDDLVVFIGIIDFLQCYNIKKKFENTCCQINNFDDPSCIAPKPYQKRFVEMIMNFFKAEMIDMTKALVLDKF